MNEVDIFKHHDEQLNSQLGRFSALSSGESDKSQILDLRGKVMEYSEDYKNSVEDLKVFIDEIVGFDPPAPGTQEVIHSNIETATITKLLSSLDALLYRDILDNKGQQYDSLMEMRDSFTASMEKYDNEFDKLVAKSDKLEVNLESRDVIKTLKVAIKEEKQEKTAEIER